MRVLTVHPGPLMYTKIFLRLEPLGLELVAAAVRRAGHEARLIDLQADTHEDYVRLVDDWQPDVVAFSCNYLANVPELVDLAKVTRARRPGWSRTCMRSCRPAICSAAAGGISSARSIPVRRSSLPGAAPGTVPSAARGRSTVGAIGWSARSARWRTSRPS